MHIAIVGAGVAGTAVFRKLREIAPSKITIISKDLPGSSPAFTNAAPWHLANTSNQTMSLSATETLGYVSWLEANGHDSSNPFLGRSVFGEYLIDTFARTLQSFDDRGIEVELIRDTVQSIDDESFRLSRVHFESGTFIDVDHVILCTGPGAPRIPSPSNIATGSRFYDNPYGPQFSRFLDVNPKANILVLGSKLSAVDAAKSILRSGSDVVMASRSASLPSVRSHLSLTWNRYTLPKNSERTEHMESFVCASARPSSFIHHVLSCVSVENPVFADSTLPALMRLKNELDIAEVGKNGWQDSVGPLIEQANLLWPLLPIEQATRLRAICDRLFARYTSAIPIESAIELSEAADSMRLDVRRMPKTLDYSNGSWSATWNSDETVKFDAVVCALGQQPPAWVPTSTGIRESSAPEILPVGVDLNLNAKSSSSKIWVVGAAATSRFPVVNYIRTAVLHAERAVNNIAYYNGRYDSSQKLNLTIR